jgi:hypothetical protein
MKPPEFIAAIDHKSTLGPEPAGVQLAPLVDNKITPPAPTAAKRLKSYATL